MITTPFERTSSLALPVTPDVRFALQDVLTGYCVAVDSLSDMDAMLACFTTDADFDLSPIGLPKVKGHEGIRGFFTGVFADMTHHCHSWSNFRVTTFDHDTATFRAYVTGRGRSKDGNEVVVHVRYYIDCVRTGAGWKISYFTEDAAMPLPGSLDEIHGHR